MDRHFAIVNHTIAALVIVFIVGTCVVVAFVRGASLTNDEAERDETGPREEP